MSSAPSVEDAKHREKEARKAAIRQASEQSLCVASDDEVEEEDRKVSARPATPLASVAKRREMEARKAAIRQASLRSLGSAVSLSSEGNPAAALASTSTTATTSATTAGRKKAPPPSSPEDIKEMEKQRRKQALQAHSRQNSSRSVRSISPLPQKKPATNNINNNASSMTAEDLKAQIRQDRLQTQNSARSLVAAAAASLPDAPASAQGVDSATAIKELEKKRRQERLQSHSRQNSGRSLATASSGLRSLSPTPRSQAERDADSKRRAATPPRDGAVTPGAVFVPVAVAPSHSMGSTKPARAPDPSAGTASCRAVEGNLDRLDALAKQRATSRRAIYSEAASNDTTHHDLEAKRPNPAQQAEASFRELDRLSVKPGAVPTAPIQGSPDREKSLNEASTDLATGTAPPTAFASFQQSVVSEIQPVPAPEAAPTPVPGAFSSTVPAGNGVRSIIQHDDSVVADLEAPAPLSMERSEDVRRRTSTTERRTSNPQDNMGLIEATLVEDVVHATIATPLRQKDDEEIRKQSAAETQRVQQLRIVVCLTLMAIAVAVTVSTYKILVAQEHENFENVYHQFARTVSDAAVEQQKNLRDSLRMFADTVSMAATASAINGTSPWPYFIMPSFEALASDFKKVANAEFVGLQNYVVHAQRDSYIDFINDRYQDFVEESHLAAYGSTKNLNNDTSFYQPYIAQKLPNGTFVEDIDRDFYFCRNHQSPPARKYGPTINNNLLVNKVIGDGFAAVMELNTEPVFTTIKPFANLPEDEHIKMHSNGIEGANNPHSFTFHPIHRTVGDLSSDIVAMFAVATAWDVSMLNLLPDNVKGMFAVLKNTCNQTVTYRIDGADANYLGEGELQNKNYDDMALFVDLNLQVHPNASTTPGHCQYSMTIYPSQDFEHDYVTSTPAVYASIVAGTFVVIAVMYFIYDISVHRRNEKMISQAAQTSAILTNLVPANLRDKIMGFRGGSFKEGNSNMGVSQAEWNTGMSNMDYSRSPHLTRRRMSQGSTDSSS